jgi:hypothetical protein
VRKEDREALADWMIVLGALMLVGSLFLTWSHQLSREFLVQFGVTEALRGVPHDPTAWQVYSAADVLLAALAAGLLGVALIGTRRARIGAVVAGVAGLAFVLRALSAPPTNHAASIFQSHASVPNYLPLSAGAGPGETLALVALLVVLAGLALSFTAD